MDDHREDAVTSGEAQDQSDALDPGAYIGSQPEREAETIPGGVRPGDQRIAANSSAPGARGEPDDTDADTLDRGGGAR